MAKDLIIRSSTEEFISFKLQEKDKGIQVRYENETLWMTQKAMAELFNVEQPAIAKYLINIYNEKELDKDSTYSKMELVQKEGNRKNRKIDVILIKDLSRLGRNYIETGNFVEVVFPAMGVSVISVDENLKWIHQITTAVIMSH